MTFTVDRRVAELLCSRICHELVAGVAAINNGVELISEIDPGMFEEAMALIGSSAKQASARVQYYRMAYGFAGHEALPSMAAVTELLAGLTEAESRYELGKNISDGQPVPLAPGWGKLLLNLSVLAMECLPKGGTIVPAASAVDGKTLLSVVGRGEEARIPDRYRGVFDGAIGSGEVSALNVHAFYTAALAEAAGARLEVEIADGTASIRVHA